MEPFRDASDIIRARADALHARRLEELRSTPTGWRSVYVQRCTRIGAGAAAVVGTMVLAGAIASAPLYAADNGEQIITGLALVWLATLVVGAMAALVAHLRRRRHLRRGLARTSDPQHDLARLTVTSPAEAERRQASRHARESWIVPLVAATLLLPHTLHALVVWLVFEQPMPIGYVRATCVLAAPTFLYGLYVAWDFPRNQRVGDAVRGAALFGLFPFLPVSALIAGVTAAVVVRVAHRPMRAIVLRERALGLGEPLAPR